MFDHNKLLNSQKKKEEEANGRYVKLKTANSTVSEISKIKTIQQNY